MVLVDHTVSLTVVWFCAEATVGRPDRGTGVDAAVGTGVIAPNTGRTATGAMDADKTCGDGATVFRHLRKP
ncbi:hypothetical protein ACNTMW_25950 [Planosporangium sp. 12N6]|uniref:hypothetical protein n=1 Tax=Planosporangium spinosum TaxID=3402278 RepID=UPI003CF1762A